MNCPTCGRKLLSQASARCNWCGETVPDADFQAQANVARAEYFAHIAAHDAASLLALEEINQMGTFQTVPILVHPLPPATVPNDPPPTEAIMTEQDDARERFRHLEI